MEINREFSDSLSGRRDAGRLGTPVLVSDRAKALIKLALHGLGCPSVPDLFHALQDLAKVLGVSLGLN